MPLDAYLVLAAALVSVGLYGALSQQAIVMVMMGIELAINGILLTIVAFWRFVQPAEANGQFFALVAFTLMAIEAAIGFAIVVAIYRARKVDTVDDAQDLKG